MITKHTTKSGKVRWVVRWYDGGRSGKRHHETFDRKGDAERFDTALRRGRQLGQLQAEVVGSEQTVKDFVAEWWTKYATAYLKPGTLASYAHVLDKWIVPYLGRMRLRDISRETIDAHVSAMLAAGAKAPTVNRTLGILQGIFARAVEWGRMPGNPVAGARRVTHLRAANIDARDPETIERIRAQLGQAEAALLSVLAYEGLRPAEAFALQWGDVIDERGLTRDRVRVRRGLSDRTISTTKTGRAREPELFAPVAIDLAELYLAKGKPSLEDLVFPDSRGGPLRRQNWRQRVWISALVAAFPCGTCKGTGKLARKPCSPCKGRGTADYFRPYDLRHSCATLLLYAGRTPNEVAEHLGHADPGFTARVYGHVLRDAKDRRVPIEDAIRKARMTLASVSVTSA